MADLRPFPPSARRRTLARAAGLTAASPWVTAAAAWLAALAVVMVLGRAVAGELGARIAEACRAPDGGAVDALVGATSPASTFTAKFLALALPLLAAAALGALVAHVVQARGVWLPRRKLPGAPALETSRAQHALLGVAGAAAVGGAAVGWLWVVAPRLARTIDAPAVGAAMLVGFVATLGAVWIAVAVADALVRRAELERSLRMSPADKREDQRLAGADPRWRARRAEAARGLGVREAVATAAVVLLGDGLAVAVAWDPLRRPVPVRTAIGRDARATQLLGLARRHAIPVHRDPELATALAGGEGPVAEQHWARLAEIVAATRGRAASI